MSQSRIPSPARSQGAPVTPRRYKSRARSVGSPARSNTSARLSALVQFKENNKDSFVLSPAPSRRSVLNDDTDIEEPRRRSWWKKLADNSRDVMEVLNDNKILETNEAVEEYIDIEVLSQEKKNYSVDIPDSSDSESISSIIIPQRKLFTQKDQAQNKFGQLVGKRETLAKLHKSQAADKTVNVAPKNLFGHSSKPRSKPVFPAALLNISPSKTANKTMENAAAEVKGQVRNLFGNRVATKRKNMFADFIVSESEDEISEIQPRVFEFPKKADMRRDSGNSRGNLEHSPTSSVTTGIEMEDWKMLPSSTMVEHQLEDIMAAGQTPVKRARLSQLAEIKESETKATADSIEKEPSNEEQELKYDDDKSEHSEQNQHQLQDQPHFEEVETEHANKKEDIIISNDNQSEEKVQNVSAKDGSDDNAQNESIDEERDVQDKCAEVQDDVVDNAQNEGNNEEMDVQDESAEVQDGSDDNKKDESAKVQDDVDDNVQNEGKNGEMDMQDESAEVQDDSNDNKQDESAEVQDDVDDNAQNEGNNEEMDVQDESAEVQDDSDVNEQDESAEVQDDEDNNAQNEGNNEETDVQDESAEVQDHSDDNEQDESAEVQDDVDDNAQNEGNNEEMDVQDESAEVQDDSDVNEQDESAEVQDDEDNNAQNEGNNEEMDVQDESVEVQDDSNDNEQNESNEEDEMDAGNESVELEEDAPDESSEERDMDDEAQNDSENQGTEEDAPNESEDEIGDSNNQPQSDQKSQNVTHDTTGRAGRKKNDTEVNSPEAIRHDNTNQLESFTAQGRNTSIRKTTMLKNLDIRTSLAPPRESTGLSDGTRNSSAEGSGWDSHRTTRKTLRQTFGRDFTPRKSLRALVMEKSAKRQTAISDMTAVTSKFPQANSTELPEASMAPDDDVDVSKESNHDVSKRTRQTTLEMYLQKIKKQNMERKLKMEEAVRNSLQAPSRDILNPFKAPSIFSSRKPKKVASKPKAKPAKSALIPLDGLPEEVIEDMKYKPPKRFQPSNASWITKRLYKFLESKLESQYDYKARVRAEKLVETIYYFCKDLRRVDAAATHAVDALKHEMARLNVVKTHFDFYQFFHEYMPREIRVKVVPDVVNKINMPRHGVFSDIIRGNTVQG